MIQAKNTGTSAKSILFPYAVEFNKQRPLPRRQIETLKPGAQIEVKWRDSPNTVGIVIFNYVTRISDDGLTVLFDQPQSVDREQVVRIVERRHACEAYAEARAYIAWLEVSKLEGKLAAQSQDS